MPMHRRNFLGGMLGGAATLAGTTGRGMGAQMVDLEAAAGGD